MNPLDPLDLPAAPTCLLLVAHPDDDAIFAGALQRQRAAWRWIVVCLTHADGSPRAQEMRAWQAGLGTAVEDVVFLGFPDDREDRRQQRCSLDEAAVGAALQALHLRPDLLVTHNARGEYGHPHHLLVHRLAQALYADVPRLEFGAGLEAVDLVVPCTEKWPAVFAAYPSQRPVIESLQDERETFRAVAPPAGSAR